MIACAGAETDHHGAKHGAGLVCVAAGPGWSYWWPSDLWDQLDQAERQRVIMRAGMTYGAEASALEDDRPAGASLAAWSELVDLNPPAWRDWRD